MNAPVSDSLDRKTDRHLDNGNMLFFIIVLLINYFLFLKCSFKFGDRTVNCKLCSFLEKLKCNFKFGDRTVNCDPAG